MNKKLFTLAVSALALLTCSLSANAQDLTGKATYDVSPVVPSATANPSRTINSINPAKYYQIAIKANGGTATNYLGVKRDVESGELYLVGEPFAGANLNETLWQVSFKKVGAAGYVYTLTNKATGYVLTFNDKDLTAVAAVKPLRSDITEWQWYSDPNVSGVENAVLGSVPFYAYDHTGKTVIGLDASTATGALKVKSVAKANFQDRDGAHLFLEMQIFAADAITLTADEFNSMIDASNGGKAILKSDPEVANALFGTKITAEEVSADNLTGAYANFNLLLGADGKYFRVAPDSTYDYNSLPQQNGGFKVGFAKLAKLVNGGSSAATDTTTVTADAFTLDPLTARYLWRATYYPTEDSLLLEPLNASSVSTYEKQLGTLWKSSKAATAAIANYFNTVNAGKAYNNVAADDNTMNVIFNKPAGEVVSLTIYNNTVSGSYDETAVLTIGQKPLGIRVYFGSTYNYLERATLADGLYFIQLASTSNNDLFRKAGKYIVANHRGNLMYDSPTSFQNYIHMPATQWVVKQDTCNVSADGTPTVSLANREYAYQSLNNVQLYKDKNGNYYSINQELLNGYYDNDGMIYRFTYKDTLTITPIKDAIAYKSYNGYQYLDSATCLFNEYNLKYLTANLYGNTTADQYLSIAKDSVLGINQTPNLAFQLVQVGDKQNAYGAVEAGDTISTTYGTIEPLARQAYILKVRDNNLIDNGWKYVAFHQDVVNQNPYYKMENLKNIDGQINKLAIFYLKNDQYVAADSTDAFALIDLVGLKAYQGRDEEDTNITTDFSKATEASLLSTVDSLLALSNPDDDYDAYKDNGWYRLAVEDQNAMSTIATLDNKPTTRVSAFELAPVAREIYMPLTDKGVLAGNNIKIYRERGINGATKEYLYEDGNNAANVAETSYVKGFNYLGITGENIAPVGKDKTVAFYVDSVLHSQKVMPQYLLYVDRDTITAGEWCNTGEHGYNAAGDSKTHQMVYNALSYGRVLVNLNDSVSKYNGTSINKLENGKKYAFENYVRLGFVPAIHINIGAKDDSSAFAQFMKPGEWLIVLNGTTFDALKSNVKGSENIIDPVAVDSAWHQGKVTFNPLDGNHQNYAFSFRYTDDTHVPFLMESQSWEGGAFPGTYNKASWVKIQNNVPVLAQAVNPLTGDHTAIYGAETLNEVINQAQILKLETTNEIATANDEIAASSVKVIAGNGVVTVKNAAGKKLVITNILGKAIANTVVTSDNATFAAPAGIVAVAVEGEPAVKAIVK